MRSPHVTTLRPGKTESANNHDQAIHLLEIVERRRRKRATDPIVMVDHGS